MHGKQTTYQPYQMHTTTILHGQNDHTMILAGSRQIIPTHRTMDMTHPCGTSLSISTLVVLTEVWHIAHFWVSYGRCAMTALPMGWSAGQSR